MITTYQYIANDSIDTRSEAIANKALSKIDAYFQKNPAIRRDSKDVIRECKSPKKNKGKK